MGVVCGKGCWPRENEAGGVQDAIARSAVGTDERGTAGVSGVSGGRELLGSNGVSLQPAEANANSGIGKNLAKAGPKRDRRDEPPGGPGATEELLRSTNRKLDQIVSGRLSGLPSVLKGVPGASSLDATAGDGSLEVSVSQARGPPEPPEEKEKEVRHTNTVVIALRVTVVLQADGRTADLEFAITANLGDLRRAATEALGLEGEVGPAMVLEGGAEVSGEDSTSLALAGVTDGVRLVLS